MNLRGIFRLIRHPRSGGPVLSLQVTRRAGLHPHTVEIVPHTPQGMPPLGDLMLQTLLFGFSHQIVTVGAPKPRLEMGIEFRFMDPADLLRIRSPVTQG